MQRTLGWLLILAVLGVSYVAAHDGSWHPAQTPAEIESAEDLPSGAALAPSMGMWAYNGAGIVFFHDGGCTGYTWNEAEALGLIPMGLGSTSPEGGPATSDVGTASTPLAVLDDVTGGLDPIVVPTPAEGESRLSTAAFLHLANQAYHAGHYRLALDCAERMKEASPDCDEAGNLVTLAKSATIGSANGASTKNALWSAAVGRFANCRRVADLELGSLLRHPAETPVEDNGGAASSDVTRTFLRLASDAWDAGNYPLALNYAQRVLDEVPECAAAAQLIPTVPDTRDVTRGTLRAHSLGRLRWRAGEISLRVAVDFLSFVTRQPFEISKKVLDEKGDIEIELEVQDVSAEQVLNLLTEPHEMTWQVRDGVVTILDITEVASAIEDNASAPPDNRGPELTQFGDFDVEVAQSGRETRLSGDALETAAFMRLADEAYRSQHYSFAIECAQRVGTLNPDCKEAADLEQLARNGLSAAEAQGQWTAAVARLRDCRGISDEEFRDVLLRLHQTEDADLVVRAVHFVKSTEKARKEDLAHQWMLIMEQLGSDVPEEEIVLRFYDVKDLVQVEATPRERDSTVQLVQIGYSPPESEPECTPTFEAERLLDAVRRGVAPESWRSENAALEINNRVLVVSQTAAVHRSINVFLQALRARGARAGRPVLEMHAVADLAVHFAPEDVVELIACTIEPDSWDRDPNSINVHEHNLVIFAPKQVQREVGELLDDLRQARK